MTTEENDVVLNTINTQKSKLVDANSLPTHQMKAFDKLRKEKQEQEEILQNLKEECDLLSKSKNEINCELSKEEEEIETVKKEYNKIQNQFIIVEGQLDGVNKLIKQSQGQEAELKQDRATIQFDLNSFLMEKKQVYFDLQQQTKNKDKLIKQLKSEQLQLRKNEESLNLINQEWENINIEYNTYPKSNNDVKESINKRIQDISHRKQLFVTQETLTEAEKAKEISVIQLNERLEFDKKDNKVSLDELHRLAQIKYDEREQKAKDFNGIKKKEDTLLEDLKEKKLLIEASKKKILDTQLKLNESAKMYSVMQNERNKFANYINSARQKCSEMREKIRICNNEIEILKTQLYNKEELMQKQRSKFVQVISMRDSLKSEICKQISVLSKQKEKRDQLQLNMQRLNQLCNQGEETLMRLRVRNDTALRNRNDRALQLIERNEEVCILQEKYNIKEDVLKIAEQEIQIRDEENTFFYQNISELKREMSLLKQQEVTQSIVERDILNLQIQISLCQDRHIELEKQVENPEGPNRTRELKGMDPTTISLQLKLEDLHFKLNEKDEFLIEKDLLYKAVNKLVLNLKSKQCEFKTDTLDVANTLNSFKFRMGHIIKKLKAKSAELTMNMSEVLKLQKNTKENQTFLNDVYKKIENGEDIESFNFNRAKYMKTLSDFSIQQFQLTNGLYTTAEPRSNAYIPDNESDLPIPHPYGAQAPFKPSEAGSSMRHIKKQKLKPIEI